MINDRLITITTAGSRKATKWQSQTLMWSDFCERLRLPQRTTETYNEYIKLPKSKQDEIKDVGGYVAGTLSGLRRKANNVTGRDVITLDLDTIPAGETDAMLKRLSLLQCGYCVYSTRKHCGAAPHLRVLLLCDRTMTADEYEPSARKIAEMIGLQYCDPTTFQASRLMYYPSCSTDSEYVYELADKPMLSADGVLALYKDWHNVSEWPGLVAPKIPRGAKQADPTAKDGIVGAFCRVYDVYRAIAELLPDVYTPCEDGRYTYAGGSTTGGAVVYENGAFLYSHHATDPASEKLCNAFDLCRLQMFGDADDDAKPDTPANKLPSFVKMCEFAVKNTDVATLLNTERYKAATADFNMPTDDTADWQKLLAVSSETGCPLKTINNVLIIIENDPLLKGESYFDEFSNRVYITGALPWDARTKQREWTDNDDAGIRNYIEKVYGINGKDRVYDACSLSAHRHTANELRDWLQSLAWDGVPRLDTLFIDYFGAEDNPYIRAVARKSMCAAAARVLQPGVKYDYVPILGGPQGIGKSMFFKILGGKYFSDSLQSFEGKDAYETIQGTWINELPELSTLSRSESNTAKQFISRTEDIFREPYGRRTGVYPRVCVFFGTTNDTEYLHDSTGERRFWPVDCRKQEPTKSVFTDLKIERDQIFAEAVFLWQLGEPLYLNAELEAKAREEQEAHKDIDPREGMIRDFIEKEIPEDWLQWPLDRRRMYWSGGFKADGVKTVPRDRICAYELWCELFNGDTGKMRRADVRDLNRILSRIPGWTYYDKPQKNGIIYGVQRGFKRGL